MRRGLEWEDTAEFSDMLLIYPAGVSNGYIKFEKNIKNFEIPEKIYLHSAIVPTAIVNACTISSRLILGALETAAAA